MASTAASTQGIIRKAFGSFLLALSKFGPWWYGISLPETDELSLSKVCGLEAGDMLLLLVKCGVTGPSPRYNLNINKLTLFLQEASLGYGAPFASGVTKAQYNNDSHCR